MTRTLRVLVTALLAGLLALTGLSPAQARTSAELGTPVPQTHAHNDYEHARPCSTRSAMASSRSRQTSGWSTASC